MTFPRAAAVALLATAICALLSPAVSHSNLASPKPMRKLVCRVGNNQRRDCGGPCPPRDTFGSPTGINEDNCATTWVRGETQFVAWQQNNHKGDKNNHGATGFTRLSLVPVADMMSKPAHEANAFHISCWGAGRHACPARDDITCGNDKDGERYGANVVVPKNYEDGVYVLGYAWYGGGDYQEKSFFGDYYGCSFIRIEGGPYVEGGETVFEPGDGNEGGCWSAADRPGVCESEPCHGKQVEFMMPLGAGGSPAGAGTGPAAADAPGDDDGKSEEPAQQEAANDEPDAANEESDAAAEEPEAAYEEPQTASEESEASSEEPYAAYEEPMASQPEDSNDAADTGGDYSAPEPTKQDTDGNSQEPDNMKAMSVPQPMKKGAASKPEQAPKMEDYKHFNQYKAEGLYNPGSKAPTSSSPPMVNSGGGGGMMKVSVVNVATGEFKPIGDSAEIMLSNYPGGINIDVSCDGNPSSIDFKWPTGKKTESTAPYMVAGNIGTKYGKWSGFPTGRSFDLNIVAHKDGGSDRKTVSLRID